MNALLAYLPLLVCGSTGATFWKCFKEVEVRSRQPFKRRVARAIQTSSIFTVGAILPTLCVSAFEFLFTGNLWSVRGFSRSCRASLVIVAILLVVWYSSIPDEWHLRFVALSQTGSHSTWWTLIANHHLTNVPFNLDIHAQGHLRTVRGDILGNQGGGTLTFALDIQQINVFGGLPFIYNAFADFAALIATGWVLQHMSTGTMRRLVITFVVFACGILALSFMALDIAVIMLKYILLGVTPSTLEEWIFNPSRFVAAVLFPFYRSDPSEWRVDTLYGVFVWSTLMGILWLAVFSASVFIANVSMK